MILHKSPDAEVSQMATDLHKLGYDTPEYWEAFAECCKSSLWFLARCVLGVGYFCEDLHGTRLSRFLAENENHDIAIFIPRGHCKTTFLSAYYTQTILNNFRFALLVASATDKMAHGIAELIASHLMTNKWLKKAFPALPETRQGLSLWGKDGYRLLHDGPPRIDPTLFPASLKTNVTGRHPDEIWLDDLIVEVNNSLVGYEKARAFINNCKALLTPSGRLVVTGTRWGDADPYEGIISGEIEGNKGRFKTLVLSCWEDDDPKKSPIYVPEIRWNMTDSSGYPDELLQRKKKDMGRFFNAQYRNDPAPADDQVINVNDIQIYEKDSLPKLGEIRILGIETTGGGLLVYNTLQEEIEKMKIFMPLAEVGAQRKQGSTKTDHIVATLEPVIRQGKLKILPWMKGEGWEDSTLWYEIKRLGAAKHDDIVDALRMVRQSLQPGIIPPDGHPADVYIAGDVAWSEAEQADFTALIAVAVDHKENYWVLDYDRFKLKSPVGIAHRIIEFYQKWAHGPTNAYKRNSSSKKSWATTYN